MNNYQFVKPNLINGMSKLFDFSSIINPYKLSSNSNLSD
ncbi:hypothetical protein MHK_010738 [Candidatus Magnetomorum sp. HK-1]|nr:hypothetical protein MHK_010738 [Candidatus Magnetomorum sp. HK-1]